MIAVFQICNADRHERQPKTNVRKATMQATAKIKSITEIITKELIKEANFKQCKCNRSHPASKQYKNAAYKNFILNSKIFIKYSELVQTVTCNSLNI